MSQSNRLFSLIKSLEPTEKRYIKVNCKSFSGKKTNYIKIFEALDKQDEYNIELLKKELKDGKLVNNLPSEMNYLYKSILKNLRDYHSIGGVDATLFNHIQDIALLYSKNLNESCLKEINKAKKLAYANERFYFLSLLIDWNIKVSSTGINNNQLPNLKKLINEKVKVNQLLAIEYELGSYYNQFLLFFKENDRHPKCGKNEILEQIITSNLLQDIKCLSTFKAKILYLSCHAIYNRIHSNPQKAIAYYKELVTLWESNPSRIKEDISAYRSVLSDYLSLVISVHEEKHKDEIVKKIQSITPKNENDGLEYFQHVLFNEFLLCSNTDNTERAEYLAGQIEFKIEYYEHRLTPVQLIINYYHLSIFHFAMGNYTQTARWASKIINDKSGYRLDIQTFVRLLNLFLCYENSDWLIFSYLYQSTYHFIKVNNQFGNYEKLLLKYLRKLTSPRSQNDIIVYSSELKRELLLLIKSENNLVGISHILTWLESKIQKKPIKGIYKHLVHQLNNNSN